MTERLYYHDSYLKSFQATVVDRADEGRRVYLDRTAFYPTSGGQPFDTGRLGGIPVIDVVDEGERMAHLLAEPVPTGTRIEGVIDWPRRFDHMQQHTGQHLLSAVIAELFGYPTVSVHFGDDVATLDLETGTITPDQIRQAELRANTLVWEDRPVSVAFETASQAAGLRKASDREGTLRIVTIADLDRSACGGTHVRTTGEIGPIVIRKAERVKKQVRLEFLCGARSLRRARADFEILSTLASSASSAAEDLPALFEKLRAEQKAGDGERRALEESLHRYRARELYEGAAAGASGRRQVIHRVTGGTVESLRGLAQAITQLPNVVLIATLDAPPTLLLGSSPDSGVDAGHVLKQVVAEFGGRGGGSARLAQGTVPDPLQMETALARLASSV